MKAYPNVQRREETMSGQAVFRIEGVRKSFGPVQVLQGVDLDLEAGAVTI